MWNLDLWFKLVNRMCVGKNRFPGPVRPSYLPTAGAVTLTTKDDPNADNWVPDIPFDAAAMQYSGGGVSYLRVPSDNFPGDYPSGDSRSVPRHNKRCNFGFFDGHAETMKNSKAGYNFYKLGQWSFEAPRPQPEGDWWAISH